MPRGARAWVGRLSSSRLSKRTAPPRALSKPITAFISVVLPAPLRPMRPIMEPLGTSSDTSRRMRIAAMETLKFSTLGTVADDVALHFRIGERRLRRGVGDDAAVVKRQHALREAAHHLHVVLDEQHRRALGAHRVEHHLHDAELLLRRDAAG